MVFFRSGHTTITEWLQSEHLINMPKIKKYSFYFQIVVILDIDNLKLPLEIFVYLHFRINRSLQSFSLLCL